MKTRLFSKITLMAMIMAIGFSFGLPNPSILFAGGTMTDHPNNIGPTLSIAQHNWDYNSDDVEEEGEGANTVKYLVLPDAAYTDGTLNISAVTTAGSAVNVNNENDDNEWRLYIINERATVYIVTYTSTNGEISTSKDFQLRLNADKYTFEWETNSQQIIPTQVNPSTETETNTIVFPYPFIYQDSETPINIGEDGKPKLVTGLNVTLRKGTESIEIATNTDDYYCYDVPVDAPQVEYTLTYSYNAGYSYTIKKEFKFNVVNASEFHQKNDVALNLSLNSSITTAWEVGVEVKLPTITVTNSKRNDAAVAVYTEYLITCTPSNGGDTVTFEPVTDYKFIPTTVGEYEIQYRVTDFAGNTKTVRHPTKSKATNTATGISVYVVGDYSDGDDVGQDKLDEMTTAALAGTLVSTDYMIPTKLKKAANENAENATSLPAIFAVDTTKSGLDDWDDIKGNFLRSITSPTKTTKYQSTSANSNEIVTEPWKAINHAFTEVGTYTIVYQVTDSAGNIIPLGRYYVTVEEDYSDTTAPEVNINGLSKTAKAGDKISFSVITTDYLPDSIEVADERLKVEVTVTVGAGSPITLTKNTDGKYEYTIPADTAMGAVVKVQATAKDFTGNEGEKEYTITVSNYSEDDTPPEVSEFDLGDWEKDSEIKDFYHGEIISLPKITFTDDSNNMVVNVNIYCNDVKVSAFGSSSWKNDTIEMGGEKITLTHIGKYKVVYEAIDANGNITLKSLYFDVITKIVPSIIGSIPATLEYGDIIDLSALVSVQENGIEMDEYFTNVYPMNASVSEEEYEDFLESLVEDDPTARTALVIQYSGGCIGGSGGLELIALTGNITIKYWAIGPTGQYNPIPKTLTTTAADTIAPTVTFNDDASVTSAHRYYISTDKATPEHPNDTYTAEELKDLNKVNIPRFTTNDGQGSGVDISTIKVVAKYQNSSTNKPEVIPYVVGDALYGDFYGYFIANGHGYVDVTYSVSDFTGNEGKASYTIAIGDVQKPVITINEMGFKESYNLNDELKIDLTKIGVEEPEKSTQVLSYSNVTVKVSLNGEDITSSAKLVEKSTSNEWYYKLDKVGEYKITFDVNDSAGNSAEQKSLAFTISTETSSTTVSTTVWGTVLIIVALLVLGGIIYFFVKPSKSKGSVSAGKNKSGSKKELNKDNKKESDQ